MERTTNLTERQAMAVYRKFCRYFKAYDIEPVDHAVTPGERWPTDGPVLVKDFETGYSTAKWAIVWEGGPYDWPQLFPHGGIDEEFGFNWPNVELPGGAWVEPINGWSTAIYPKDW